MMGSVLWLSLGLMIASSILPRKFGVRKLIGGVGWGMFSIHWGYQPLHYIKIQDYANVFLTIAFALFCLFIAFIMFREYRGNSTKPGKEKSLPSELSNPGTKSSMDTKSSEDMKASMDITSRLTSATALGALVYFPFANFSYMNTWIISNVTSEVVWILQYFGVPAYAKAWNMITFNGYTVEIILACTAIESIALFMGLIGSSVKAPPKRLIAAFIVSVPVIYILNLIRDAFVVIAYGGQWFGANSFVIAHNYIAKAGSGIALFLISYAVLRILPELFDLIDGLWILLSEELRNLLNRSVGD